MASNELQDARHELLLSAFCAMAGALPRRSQEQIALTVSARADQLTAELPEDQDAALASDLARLLGALGWLPQAVAPSAVAVKTYRELDQAYRVHRPLLPHLWSDQLPPGAGEGLWRHEDLWPVPMLRLQLGV